MIDDEIIDVLLCEICFKPLPKGRRKYCSDDCLAEGKRRTEAERQKNLRENQELESNWNPTNPGMITISIEQFREIIVRTEREARQVTTEEIYSKTVEVIDSRIALLQREFTKKLEQLPRAPALEEPPKPVQTYSIEEHRLKDTNPAQFKRIVAQLKELHEITRKSSYAPFNKQFDLKRHDQLPEGDGNRAEDWLTIQIRNEKRKRNRQMTDFLERVH